MKKLLILLLLLLAGTAGYYVTFGSARLTQELKGRVESELQLLQKNGFKIEERKIEARREHFDIRYADPLKIARYLRSRNIDLSDEDAEKLKDLKIGIDLEYLRGVYSALSADIYPVAFPPALLEGESPQSRENLRRIANEKIFLLHIDINKLFTSFKGYLKDIDATFRDVETLRIVSRGFKFGGSYSRDALLSSTHSIDELNVTEGHNATFRVKNLSGNYERSGKTLYDYSSGYHIEKLSLSDEEGAALLLEKLKIESSGKSDSRLASSDFGFHLERVDIDESHGRHSLQDLNGRFSLANLPVDALEKMRRLDSHDQEGFNQAFRSLFTEGIILKMEDLSARTMREKNGRTVDGFEANATVTIDKIADLKRLEENPFALLGLVDATVHIALSNALYLSLMEQPEFTIAMLIFRPISKEKRKIFNIKYRHGSLLINGQKAL